MSSRRTCLWLSEKKLTWITEALLEWTTPNVQICDPPEEPEKVEEFRSCLLETIHHEF